MSDTNQKLTFPALFDETLRRCGKSNAYAFAGEEPVTFEEAGRQIRALSAFLEKAEIHNGDRVALLSTNMPNWPLAYFSAGGWLTRFAYRIDIIRQWPLFLLAGAMVALITFLAISIQSLGASRGSPSEVIRRG